MAKACERCDGEKVIECTECPPPEICTFCEGMDDVDHFLCEKCEGTKEIDVYCNGCADTKKVPCPECS